MSSSPEQGDPKQSAPPNYVRLKGSKKRHHASAKFLGPAKSNRKFAVTIVLRRRPDGPEPLGFVYFATTPPSKQKRLSSEEFAASYGAHPKDMALVTDFVQAHGLKILEAHARRRTIEVSGTAAQMNKAFGVTLGRYTCPDTRLHSTKRVIETYRGRSGFIHIPRRLSKIIVGVFGLDNRNISRRANGDPANTAALTVQQITSFYNFPANSAAGQTIAIFSVGGYDPGDLTNFFGANNVPQIIPISVGADNGDADLETTQDICIAGAAAPGAAIAVYFAPGNQAGWFNLIQRVIHPSQGDPICHVLSCSYFVSCGDDEVTMATEGVTDSWIDQVHSALHDAAIQKVTFCAVSGDYGVDSTSQSKSGSDQKAHVTYPGSDPWALCCGGTTVGNVNKASFDEYVWNDDAGATGGGVSNHFPLPDYQQNANVPVSLNGGQSGRGVPDVAGNASPHSGYAVTLNGSPAVANGTSAVAPLYAGLMALLNAVLGSTVGFINSKLYSLQNTVCRDVNPLSVNPPAGPTDNGYNGVAGYPAGPGWDACTGLGSVNGTALLNAFQQANSQP